MTLLKGVSKWLEGPTEINTIFVPAKTKRDIKEVRKDIKSQPTKPAGTNKSITKTTGAKKVVVVMNKNGRLQRIQPAPSASAPSAKPPMVKPAAQAQSVQASVKAPPSGQASAQVSAQVSAQPKEDILTVIKKLSTIQLQQLVETANSARISEIYNLLMRLSSDEAVKIFDKFSYKAQQSLFLKFNIDQQRKVYEHFPKFMQRQIYEKLTTEQQRNLDKAQSQNRQLIQPALDAINGTRSAFNNNGRNAWNGSTGGYDGSTGSNEVSALRAEIRKLKEDKKQNENE